MALHTLLPGQSTIPQPHPISADQRARSTQLLKRSTPANSLKQMRANLRIGYVNQSRTSPNPAVHRQTRMTRR